MTTRMGDIGRATSRAFFALVLGAWIFPEGSATGQEVPSPAPAPKATRPGFFKHKAAARRVGSPGFQGFGLGYHLGYGYGGDAVGVGGFGGDPFYGGPGYPHASPCLKRIGGITPFPVYGGSPGQPNVFDGVGGLAPDDPVVTFDGDSGSADYGCFNGMIPYPESTFAPFTSQARDAGGPPTVPNAAPSPMEAPIPPAPVGPPGVSYENVPLGVEVVPVADASRRLEGMKVVALKPGGLGEKAGLRDGDVIRSANGYATDRPGNLEWVIANASPDDVLKLTVRGSKFGEVRTITARRR